MYKIIFKSPAKRFIKKLDRETQKIILKKIRQLEKNPRLGKPLVGSLSGLWRLRTYKYRVVYQIKNEELIIYVLNIGHRKEVY
ncbi:MAG: type II toxin-antitoxin system RelE/ParE family toxin [Nitrosopumilus sp.]